MMQNQKYFFITKSNFRKLTFTSKIEVEKDLDVIYLKIYEKSDLSRFLNHKEAKSLRKITIFLQEAEEALIKIEKQNKDVQMQKQVLGVASIFLFPSGPPRYHSDETCETLKRDFDNFIVPEEINKRGESEVNKFRIFAQKNRTLLRDGREDVFLLRLKNEFNLKSNVDKVIFPNSGKMAHMEKVNRDVNVIEFDIENSIIALESFRLTEEGKSAIKSYMYGSTKALFNNTKLTNTERQLLEEKKLLIDLVIEYHIMKSRRKQTVFSSDFLNFYGFQPCGTCCGHLQKFDLPI